MSTIAFLQPEIPHYRTEFFSLLGKRVNLLDLYAYDKREYAIKQGFCPSTVKAKHIRSFSLKGVLFYEPFVFFTKRYDVLVLMLHQGHFTTWLLLLTKLLHHKRIVLWGQGISVQRYLKEVKKVNPLLRWMISMADGVLLYTAGEVDIWKKIFPQKPMVSFNNTISGISDIVKFIHPLSKTDLMKKYGIKEKTVFLFCARFNSNYRRVDLLLSVINKLDNKKFAFVIIGKGDKKPDFSRFKNVYDMGEVYERSLKNDLFSLSDIYFQPGWVGLSIVEAMGYGLPIFTFRRSCEIKQCVEYYYIQEGYNGLLFDDVDDFVKKTSQLTVTDISQMGHNARDYVKNNLTMKRMVESVFSIL